MQNEGLRNTVDPQHGLDRVTGGSTAGSSGAGSRATSGDESGAVRETPTLIASDKVEGTPVRRSDGEKIGVIERVMIEKRSGKVAYAVMSFGGFMGMGEGYHTVPWSVLKYNTALDAYEVNLSEDQLKGAPPRTSQGQDASFDRDWEEHVHRYYNAAPYWGV